MYVMARTNPNPFSLMNPQSHVILLYPFSKSLRANLTTYLCKCMKLATLEVLVAEGDTWQP